MYVEKQGHKRCTGRFGESGANKVDPEKTFRVCLIIILWFLGDKKKGPANIFGFKLFSKQIFEKIRCFMIIYFNYF